MVPTSQIWCFPTVNDRSTYRSWKSEKKVKNKCKKVHLFFFLWMLMNSPLEYPGFLLFLLHLGGELCSYLLLLKPQAFQRSPAHTGPRKSYLWACVVDKKSKPAVCQGHSALVPAQQLSTVEVSHPRQPTLQEDSTRLSLYEQQCRDVVGLGPICWFICVHKSDVGQTRLVDILRVRE